MQGALVMRLVGLADGTPSDRAGQYVRAFDPSAGGGRGLLETTTRPGEARTFASRGTAAQFYRRQAAPPHDRRQDGQPNRPLTAWNVEVLTLRKANGWR